MNLDDMLKEASIIDHSWYDSQVGLSGVDVNISSKMHEPNNSKPELEVEWGEGGPSIDIEDENVVERNIPEGDTETSGVILFARDMMNRGMMGEELIAALKDRFDTKTMTAEQDALREQLGLQGFVGCVAVDGRGYKSCKEALASAENSPYKNSISFVIGCSCGDSLEIPVTGEDMTLVESSGNSMDDFMASDGQYEPKAVACCPTTRLPIVSAQSDIDDDHMAPAVIDLMNVTGLPAGDLDEIEASDASWQEKVKRAFKASYRAAKTAKKAQYAEKVDASEHRLQQADNEIELTSEAAGQIDLEADVADIELEASGFEVQDIDMGQDLSGIFEGSDEVALDEAKEAKAQLDVDIRPDMTL